MERGKRAVRTTLLAVFLASMLFNLVVVKGLFFPTGIVAWWPAEGNANDSCHANDGTLYGDVSFAAGKIGQAFSLDGTGDYVAVVDDALLKPSDITVDAWFYATDIAGKKYPPIVRKAGWIGCNGACMATLEYGYSLEINHTDSKVRFFVYISGSWLSSPAASVTTGSWYHVAGSFDGSKIRLYLNGNPVGTPTNAMGTITHSNLSLSIGAEESPALDMLDYRYFQGLIDEVEIFNRALSDAEVKDIYDGLKEEPPIVESCDSRGNKKDSFLPADDVYVYGQGYPIYAKMPLDMSVSREVYVVEDTTWMDGMTIPLRVPGAAATTLVVDPDPYYGQLASTLVWNSTLTSPLTPGKYDIVIDVNHNGIYDEAIDALDDLDIDGTAGFFVIPEYLIGSIMGLAGCFVALAVFYAAQHKHKHQY